MRFEAATLGDFDALERALAALQCSTPAHCSFLRTFAYLRFRMRALYHDRAEPVTLHAPGGVRLDYTPDAHGGYVTVVCEAGAGDAPEAEPESQQVYQYRDMETRRPPGRPRKDSQVTPRGRPGGTGTGRATAPAAGAGA